MLQPQTVVSGEIKKLRRLPSEDFLNKPETLDNTMLLITCFMTIFPTDGMLGEEGKGDGQRPYYFSP